MPVGATQVDAILRAEWGDVWRIVDTGSVPGIDRTVRVLGQSVSITPSSIEVDAVTEDLTGDIAPTPPGAPVLVSATPGNAQVTLTWTAPASSGSSAITGYTVTASPGGATCTTTGLTCTVSGLTNGTAYTFTVKATSAVGTGPASNALSATPVAPPPPYRDVIMATSGLVGYWRLDEPSGTLCTDQTGANNANYNGTVTRGVTGAIPGNAAITLNGNAANFIRTQVAVFGDVERPAQPEQLLSNLDVGDVFTLEAWVNRNGAAPTSWSDILSRGANAFYMRMDGSTGAIALLKSQAAGIVTSTAGVPVSGWHHVVCTKNGATVKQYIDGADVTGTVSNATCVSVNNFVSIGGDTFGSGISEPFNGSLDEPAIYSRALSASEVLAHYNARNN